MKPIRWNCGWKLEYVVVTTKRMSSDEVKVSRLRRESEIVLVNLGRCGWIIGRTSISCAERRQISSLARSGPRKGSQACNVERGAGFYSTPVV